MYAACRFALFAVFIGGASLIGVTSAAGQSIYAEGVVFDDRDQDGVQDKGEPGIAGVSVSNQHDVVETGADGSYRLPVRASGTIIFVTQPPGYRVPVNEHNAPQFYYVHRPTGTPDSLRLRYQGVTPTGPLPERINFPLIATDTTVVGRPFTAVALADPQPLNDRELDFLRDDVIAELVHEDVAFAVVAGDLMHDDLSLFGRYKRLMGTLGVPVWNVPGNHDINFEAPNDAFSLESYIQHFGPPYYSFDVSNVHFVVLDNVSYDGRASNQDPFQYRRGGTYRGYISESQLAWLENDLQLVPRDRRIVIITHIPIRTRRTDHYTVNTTNREALFDLIEGRKALLLSGHTHATEQVFLDASDGWSGSTPLHQYILTTASGSWWQGPTDQEGIPITPQSDGTPNGYQFLHFTERGYHIQYKPARRPTRYQIRTYVETEHHNNDYRGLAYSDLGEQGKRIRQEQLHAARLVANFFNGSHRDTLQFCLNNGSWQPMQYKVRPDPWYTELTEREAELHAPKALSRPSLSRHIWQASIPDSLEPGVYTLDVRAKARDGTVHHTTHIFEVVGQ